MPDLTTTPATHRTAPDRDWRCTCCFKLLGRRSDASIHVRFARGHQYMLSGHVTALCRCGTLNELRA